MTTMWLKCRAIILLFLIANISFSDAEKVKNTSLPNVPKVRTIRGMINSLHYVTTADEYILMLIRISHDSDDETPLKYRPVLLVHGMYQSSDKFTKQATSQSLAIKLQELGYDVWLFNARGNKYSRNHTRLNPETDPDNFFNYTYEEIGYYDLAAVVDYILTQTRFKKIHYISHSFGGTYFLILNALRPQYNKKFHSAYLMAPIVYHDSFPNSQLQGEFHRPVEVHFFQLSLKTTPWFLRTDFTISHNKFCNINLLQQNFINLATYEIFPYNSKTSHLGFTAKSCIDYDEKWGRICDYINIQTSMGLKPTNNSRFDTRGGSIKHLVHWGQIIQSKRFRRWDYKAENIKKYGVAEPPEYNLTAVTVPTTIIYALTDEVADNEDIAKLARVMVNASTRKVDRKEFKHDDFINHRKVMSHVYSVLIANLPENPEPKLRPKPIAVLTDESSSILNWVSIAMSLVGILIYIVSCCQITKKKNNS